MAKQLVIIKIFSVLIFLTSSTSLLCTEALNNNNANRMKRLTYVHPVENVTVVQGGQAVMTCSVEKLEHYKLAWINWKTSNILSTHTHVITRDPRITVTRNGLLTWRLHIRNAQPDDSGPYLCQVNTDEPISRFGFLHVVEASPPENSLATMTSKETANNGQMNIVAKDVKETTTTATEPDNQCINFDKITDSKECGGLILVTDTVSDLTYKNPDDKNSVQKTCIWIIKGDRSGPVGLTLVANKKRDNGGFNRGKLSLQTQFLHLISTVPRPIQNSDEGIEIVSEKAVTVLVFTSRGGQRFHLRLRSLVQNVVMSLSSLSNVVQAVKTLKVNVDRLGVGGGQGGGNETIYKFSYPPIPGQKYSDQEHRIVILQAVPGTRIHVNVDFVDTEQNVDHLNVFSFSSTENRFLFLQRFTGNLGPVEDASFEAGKNEPVLLYLKTFGDTVGLGFKISYSYQAAPEDDNNSVIPAWIRPFPDSGCGGLIILPKHNQLSFRNEGNDSSKTCIWGIWAQNARHIGFTFNRLPNLTASSSSEIDGQALSLQRRFRGDASTVGRVIKNEDLGEEIVQTEAFILLIFTSHSGQAFDVNFREIIRPKKGAYTLNLHTIGPQPGTFAYPLTPWPSHMSFSGYDYRFLVFEAVPERRLHLSVNYVRTTAPNDRLTVFSYSRAESKFLFLQKFSGSLGNLQNTTFQGQENQPVLLYFRTDPTAPTNGFNVSYSYNKKEGKRLNSLTTRELQNDDLCPLLNPQVLVNYWPVGDVFAGRLVYTAEGGNSVEDCAKSCCASPSCNYALLTASVCYMLTCDTSTPELCDPVELTEEDSKTANVNLVVVRRVSTIQIAPVNLGPSSTQRISSTTRRPQAAAAAGGGQRQQRVG